MAGKKTLERSARATLILFVLTISACSMFGGNTAPPPNPVGQSSQPPSASSPSSPAPPASSSSAPRPLFFDFPDIPVPQELNRLDSETFVFQSGPLKAGLLTLRGTRVDLGSLVSFFQMAMPRENWKAKGGFHSKRNVLIFEKPDKTAVINIYEKMLRTYVEIYVAPTGS
ncbi:MAG TPA: hypothetical protein PLM79_10135 [Syntrophobacteraceae bacterium]|nr:hypothetical protein [Syntrophobacteraceae bacterium]